MQMKKRKTPDIEITELIMAKADWHRTFIGEINCFTDLNYKKFVTGKVFVQDGYIWSMATDRFELNIYLDDICKLKLDYRLHEITGVTSTILNQPLFLN
jgi:hypothetical protein